MKFCELSDSEWELIRSFLPSRPVRGRKPMVDGRSLINGILYVATTGCRWRDMPSKYGSYITAWRMLRGLQEVGVWDRILSLLAASRRLKSIAIANWYSDCSKAHVFQECWAKLIYPERFEHC